jgi:Ca2+-binding RTX toxin-like protein
LEIMMATLDSVSARNGLNGANLNDPDAAPIQILNDILNGQQNQIDGFAQPDSGSFLPETTGGSEEILLANNIRLRSNEEPLAGLYGTTTIDIAPGVGLEFYEGVAGIPGIIQDIGNGQFDPDSVPYPTVMLRVKLNLISDVRTLPPAIRNGLESWFEVVRTNPAFARFASVDDFINAFNSRASTAGSGNLSVVFAFNTEDAIEFLGAARRGELDTYRMETAEIRLAFTQRVAGGGLFWFNFGWPLAPGIGENLPNDGSTFPLPNNGESPVEPPAFTPIFRIGYESPKVKIFGRDTRLGAGLTADLENRPGGPTLQLSDGRVVDLPEGMGGVLDFLGILSGAGTSEDAENNGVPPLTPPDDRRLTFQEFQSELAYQLTGGTVGSLNLPELSDDEIRNIQDFVETVGEVTEGLEGLRQESPITDTIWTAFLARPSRALFRIGLFDFIATNITADSADTIRNETLGTAYAPLGLSGTDMIRAGWNDQQRGVYEEIALTALEAYENGMIDGEQFVTSMTVALFETTNLNSSSSLPLRVSDLLQAANPESTATISFGDTSRFPDLDGPIAPIIATTLLDMGVDPIQLTLGLLEVYNSDIRNDTITQNAEAIWNSGDPRLQVATAIVRELFGDPSSDTILEGNPYAISVFFSDLSTLGGGLDALYNSPGFDRARFDRLAARLLELGYDINLGSRALGNALNEARDASWRAKDDIATVREFFSPANGGSADIGSGVNYADVVGNDQFGYDLIVYGDDKANALADILYNSYLAGGHSEREALEWTAAAYNEGGLSRLEARAREALGANVPNIVTRESFERLGMDPRLVTLAKGLYDSLRQHPTDPLSPQEAWDLVWGYYISGDSQQIYSGLSEGGLQGGFEALWGLAYYLGIDPNQFLPREMRSMMTPGQLVASLRGDGGFVPTAPLTPQQIYVLTQLSQGLPADIKAKYPDLKPEQLVNAVLNFGALLPGGVGQIFRDGQKLYDIYEFADQLKDVLDGKGNPPNFVNSAATIVSWAIPGTKDEIAVAQKLYGLVNASIKLAKTPAQIAQIQAAIDNLRGFSSNVFGVSLSVGDAGKLVNATNPGALNPGALAGGNILGLASAVFSFVPGDVGRIGSMVTGIASNVALLMAGAINPVLGVVGIFAAFLGGVLGLSKPSKVPLGEFDALGTGTANAKVDFTISDKDFRYTLTSGLDRLDIEGASFRLHAVEVVPEYEYSDRGSGDRLRGYRLAREDDDRDDVVTKYYLDADFIFGGLFGGMTDKARGSLPSFDDGQGRDGDGLVTGYEISEADYNRLKRFLGEEGSLSGNDGRMDLLKDFVGDAGPVAFYQKDSDKGLITFQDVNGDGIPDLVRQDIEVGKYRDGDGGADITLYDEVGRQIVRFSADSMGPEDLQPALLEAMRRVTVGPMDPIGPISAIGPAFNPILPDVVGAEGPLTPEAISALGGLNASVADLLQAAYFGENVPAWLAGWTPQRSDGITLQTGTTLEGTGKDDLLFGFNSDDNITGKAGNDRIAGAGGGDRIDGGKGHDLLLGNDGDDRILGGEGLDYILGGAGADRLDGGADDDYLYGGTGNDRILGGAGNDLADGGLGRDRLDGGEGNDILSYADFNRRVAVDLATGRTAWGAAGDRIANFEGAAGGAGNDILRGTDIVLRRITVISGGENMLSGGAGNDRLSGRGGNDLLIGGAGRDLIDGGTGNDIASYAGSDAGVTVSLATGRGSGGEARGDRLISIEGLTGSAFGDSLTGGTGDNQLIGGPGDDRLFGKGGNDLLIGGAGRDLLNGGSGNDMVSFADLAPGENGRGVTVDLASQIVGGVAEGDRLVSIEGVIGTEGADRLTGSDGLNRLEGAGGDDRIDGGGGNDKLFGGDGVDVIVDRSGENDLIGGAGDDWLIAGRGRDLLSGDDGRDTLRAGGGADLLKGGRGGDFLFGAAGNDRIQGGAGNDSIVGGGGRDRIDGGAGADRIAAGRGDTVIGGAGRDMAVIEGRARQFELQELNGGWVRLIDRERGRGGVIELKDVERIAFDDGLYRVAGDRLVRIGDVPPERPIAISPGSADPAASGTPIADSNAADPAAQLILGAFADASGAVGGENEPAPTPANTAVFAAAPADTGVSVDLTAGTAVFTPPAETPPADIPAPPPVTPQTVNAVGTAAADTIAGNNAANALAGLGGDDRLNGGLGNDMLSGGAGSDRILGGAGNDTLILRGGEARYKIVHLGGNQYRIRDTVAGTADTVSGVEFVRFWNGDGDRVRLKDLPA